MSAAQTTELPRPFGPYELLRRLAVGGVAEVFLARARSVAGFEKAVALKMIHPTLADDAEFTQGLIEEANITSQLSHKNIVQVIDLGQVDGLHYIAMEYVDGIDVGRFLDRVRKSGKPLSPRIAAYILREVCEGLDHAHRKTSADGRPLRIVHRDVSPGNVLLSFSGEVKLSDFGLARASLRASETQAGEIKGKYNYMSPEQARGLAIDPRADVFAAGVMLYEMVTGQPAYPSAPLPILLERVTRGLIEPAEKLTPTLPPQLAAILKRATAADPNQRHASARALVEDLTTFLYTLPPGPELELSRMIEEMTEAEHSAAQPLGAMLVDDTSDDVTQIETAASMRAKFDATPKAIAPSVPAVSPEALAVDWGDELPDPEPAAPAPDDVRETLRPVSSATPRAKPEERIARSSVRAPTLPPTGLTFDKMQAARDAISPQRASRPEVPSAAVAQPPLAQPLTPAVVAAASTGQHPTQAAPPAVRRKQNVQLIAAAVLALLSVVALVTVVLVSGR